jgi:hypothetical protein
MLYRQRSIEHRVTAGARRHPFIYRLKNLNRVAPIAGISLRDVAVR